MIDSKYKIEGPPVMAALQSYRSCFGLTIGRLARFRRVIVVLLVVDLLAVFILFTVDLLLLLLGQRTTVGVALIVNLLGDLSLVPVGPGLSLIHI